MKKLLYYSLIALTLLAVPSCSKDKEDEPTTILISSLTLDNTSITIEEGKTFTLTATVAPDNATDKTVSWTTSDAAVATVSDGVVFAIKEGEATITATAGEKSTECTVTVKPILFTVTFDTDGGSNVSLQTVAKGKTTTRPDTPKKANVYFKAWYLGDKEYDFSTAVTSDITLKAHWWIPENLYVAKAFSVSETKKVYFSSGNLQYHCKNKEWRFAPLQYDFIGDGNKKISATYDGYIDLFGWGTGDNPILVDKSSVDYLTFTDWGTNIDGGNVWQTLSLNEWKYLINGRENASEKYGVAEVAGEQGLILLPDGWELPAGLSFNSGVANEKDAIFYKEQNYYSAADWQKMESAGAVFLPCSGYRFLAVSVSVIDGCYWSSSINGDFGESVEFNSKRISNPGFFLSYGLAVRLVRPL